MSSIDLPAMRHYLSRSISSFNKNKLNGVLAEIDFRRFLAVSGFGDRVSLGGWLARSEARGGLTFGEHAVALFPEIVLPLVDFDASRHLPQPSLGLHTICATFHQLGIRSYFCSPTIGINGEATSIDWNAVQLGLPVQQRYKPLTQSMIGFTPRVRRHAFLRDHKLADVTSLPDPQVPEEFTKENLRVEFSTAFYGEVSDIDGLFWGQRHTYPIEIKEKTVANDKALGDYFGLDIGPFVKLAYFAAKRGNLHSLFVVREIDHVESRSLVNWWFITFDRLAQYASWNFVAGGAPGVGGGRGGSATVKIPRSAFDLLDPAALSSL